ncbi:hypothetical protein F4778DRAFT_790032 [Xylariomycetidae sp. FL2044]|nr:hypothetical protein F4778DRAFT_790032 [Xylariomycetidae sp. FL2044]
MSDLTTSARLNFGAIMATLSLAIVAITMRFIVRVIYKQKILPADLMCVAATVFFITYSSLIINFIFVKSQYHALDANPLLGLDELVNLSKMTFIAEIVFGCGITSIKLSILWLYNTLFSVKPNIQRSIHVVASIAILWFIVVTCIIVFQCKPISAYWETVASPEYCSSNTTTLLGYEMTNLFIDVAILCIPIAALSGLRMAMAKKVSVIMVFLLGALVCVFSILRLTAIYRLPDPAANLDFPFVLFWATLQLGMAIFLSCLPTLGPILSLIPSPVAYVVGLYDSIKSRHTRSLAPSNIPNQYGDTPSEGVGSQRHPWLKVNNNTHSHSWQVSRTDDEAAGYVLQSVQPRSIMVNRDFEIV